MTRRVDRIGTAEEKIIRTFARVIGVGALVFCVVLIPILIIQSRELAPWYTPVAAVVVFVPLLALWPASFAEDLRWIRGLGSLCAATYLLAAAGWLVTLQGQISPTREVWMSAIPGLVAMAAALGWRPAPSVLFLVVSASTAEVIRHVTRGDSQSPLLAETFNVVMTNSLFVVATIAAVQSGRTLDRTLAAAERQSAATAAASARNVERKRFDGLIHDRIMSTLLGISRHGNTDHLSGQSAVALAELDRLRASDVATEDLDVDAAVALIRTALVEVDENASVDLEVRDATLTVPREVARAMASAAAEALRNSLRHADHPEVEADRLVIIDVDTEGLRMLVADNGRGFDPARVPQYRLGISVSISARMTAAGCTSEIHSVPDRGTQVTLRWAAP
ncbi:sensor histidine kinase [Rhodococcus oryzae]|uniref:sensor histidine kinase n=1 Tax=Rhodococcus oryzae TaxID=2571143 RepID=UPI003712B0F7